MAEALGVASSIAGIVSLGIQVTQGLLHYYGSWKGQDNDISDMYASLDNLSETLKILSKTIQPPARFDRSIKDSVEENVSRTDGAVGKLNDELRKIKDSESTQSGARSTMRRHVRRLLYPLKEETLTKIKQSVSEARQNLDLALQVLQIRSISDIDRKVTLLVRWQEDTETRHILRWLSKRNFWIQQVDVSNQRQPGTGQWLLRNSDFLEWVKGNKETVWCRGNPGVGKTVLASVVVEFLESDLPIQDIAFAFIYCNHKENLQQSIEYFVGAIIRQIVERRQVIPEDVHTLYQKHCGKETSPTCIEYLDLLQSLAEEYSEVYVVIDALDECIDKDGQLIWTNLLTKLKVTVPNLHLLFTSRHISNPAEILTGSTLIDIRASEADISAYVQEQLQSHNALIEFCQQEPILKDHILQAVISKAEGIFLAARLYLGSLASKTNRKAIKKALRNLPATLDRNYDEAMERIKQQPTQILAFRVLEWIIYAVRPLQLEEVQHAVAVDELEPDDRSVSEESLTPQSIIVNACAGMIKIDEQSNTISLVHKTTQDYFDRSGTDHFPHAQRNIGITCLKYLLLEVFSDGHCSNDKLYQRRLKENTLLAYAAQNFGNHICGATEHSVHNLALKFFLDTCRISCASQALFVDERQWYHGCSQAFPKDFHGMHFAAYFGLEEVARLLLGNSQSKLDSEDSYGRTPLSHAASQGHEAMVKLLLEKGAELEVNDSYDRTPLSLAASQGYESMVKLLLEKGAELETKDYYGLTPLAYAVSQGHEAMVKLLLEKGAELEAKDSHGLTPLADAASQGHESMVKLLLEKGAELEAKDSYDRTPLSHAASQGHESMVKLLLEKGAELETKDSYGRTPLAYAARYGNHGLNYFLESWSYLSGFTKGVPRISSQGLRASTWNSPDEISADDLNGDNFDIQGINWEAMETTRKEARKLRPLLHFNYTDLKKSFGLLEGNDISNTKYFFQFKRNLLRHVVTSSHFQLRNLLTVASENDIFYAGKSGVHRVDAIFSKNTTVMDLTDISMQSPYWITSHKPIISTLTSGYGVLIAGGFLSEYSMISLDRSASNKPLQGLVTEDVNGTINHIHIIRSRSSDNPMAVFSSNDRKIRLLDCYTNKVKMEHNFEWAVNCSATSPDGRMRVIVGDSTQVAIVNAETGEILQTLDGHQDYGFACSWADDGVHVATGNQDMQVLVWDARMWGRPLRTINANMAGVRSLKFSPTGSGKRVLLMAEPADIVSVVDAELFESKQTLDFFGEIGGMDFVPGGQDIYIANTDELRGGLMHYERIGHAGR